MTNEPFYLLLSEDAAGAVRPLARRGSKEGIDFVAREYLNMNLYQELYIAHVTTRVEKSCITFTDLNLNNPLDVGGRR